MSGWRNSGALATGTEPARDLPQQEYRVDQRVLVVRRHDQRPGFRNVLEADEIDGLVNEAAGVQTGLTRQDVDAPGH